MKHTFWTRFSLLIFTIDPCLSTLNQRLQKWNLTFITTSPLPTILRHPFSLMITPSENWYGGMRMMMQTQITPTITLPNNYKILPRFQAALIWMLSELIIVLSYPPRYIPLLLINALWIFLNQHHHRIIPDTNPGTTISLPNLSHLNLCQHPTHGIVNVTLFVNNWWLTTI